MSLVVASRVRCSSSKVCVVRSRGNVRRNAQKRLSYPPGPCLCFGLVAAWQHTGRRYPRRCRSELTGDCCSSSSFPSFSPPPARPFPPPRSLSPALFCSIVLRLLSCGTASGSNSACTCLRLSPGAVAFQAHRLRAADFDFSFRGRGTSAPRPVRKSPGTPPCAQ